MSSSERLSDNEVAFAAINLFANEPNGTQPDLQDIEDWHNGLLSENRAEEVLSHVANNGECFQMWRDICEAEQWLADNPLEQEALSTTQEAAYSAGQTDAKPSPLNLMSWLRRARKAWSERPLPAIGGAVAATVLAVLIVPKLVTSPTSGADMVHAGLEQYSALGAPLPADAMQARATRSLAGVLGNVSDEAVEKHQLSLGMRQGFDALNVDDPGQWTLWYDSLETDAIDCASAANAELCQAVSTDAATIGQWALVNHLACQNADALPDGFVAEQTDALTTLSELDSLKQSALIGPSLSSVTETGHAKLCTTANTLMLQAVN